MLRRFIRAFAFVSVATAATACSNALAPKDDLTTVDSGSVPCSQSAPAAGMVCRGDVWNWN